VGRWYVCFLHCWFRRPLARETDGGIMHHSIISCQDFLAVLLLYTSLVEAVKWLGMQCKR